MTDNDKIAEARRAIVALNNAAYAAYNAARAAKLNSDDLLRILGDTDKAVEADR